MNDPEVKADTFAAVDAEALEQQATAAIAAAKSLDELDAARVAYLGRKSELEQALREVRDRETGMLAERDPGASSRRPSSRSARSSSAPSSSASTPRAPSTSRCPESPSRAGRLHLLTQIRREIEDVFLGMGYEVYEGTEVVDAWHNFDALTTDRGHPSRSPNDTFYLPDDVLLRTHTSPDQIRLMESRQPPIYAIMPGRCYRRDTPDATHSPTFLQVEAPRRRPRHHARRPEGDRAALLPRSSSARRARCACGRASSRSPSLPSSST